MANNMPTLRGFAGIEIPEIATKTARRMQAEALDREVRTFGNYFQTWKAQNADAFRLWFHEVVKREAVTPEMIERGEACPAFGMIAETAKADRKHSNVPLLFMVFLMESHQAARLIPHFTTDAEIEREEKNGARLMTGAAFANFIRRMMITPTEWTPRILELMNSAERVNLCNVTERDRADKYAELIAATPNAPKIAPQALTAEKVATFADVDPFDPSARRAAARAAEKAAKKAAK